MRTLIISDTHLGAPTFKRKDALLALLGQQWDRIIVNGDFLELLGFKTLPQIKEEFKEIFDALERTESFYIKGNHDEEFGVRDCYTFFLPNGESVAVTHGHVQDGHSYKWVVKLNWVIYQVLGVEVRRLLNRFKSYRSMNERVLKQFSNYDHIILGHSHKPGFDGKIINGGDMIEHDTYIVIEGCNISLRRLT